MKHIPIEEKRRIIRDLRIETAPERWTGAYIHERFVEAFLVLARLPGHLGPDRVRGVLGGLALPETEGTGQGLAGESRMNRPPPSPAQISRMDRAFEWCGLYLAEDEEARRSLLLWSHGKAHGRRTAAILGQAGLTRSDFDAARRRGAFAIAVCLDREGRPID